ncbi:MAG: hypothetical protein HFJ84_11025 [Clostridiales bacterium]|jgi:hypothetical protein|nr:hypothetical protein [Clostridiales bacterium]
MKNNIQNIFIDLKSYELIQSKISVDALVSLVFNGIDILKIQPIFIKGYPFMLEYRSNNPHLTYMYTIPGYHTIDPYENEFTKNVILYNPKAIEAYEDNFCGAEILLYTNKPSLIVIPYDGNGLSRMDSSTGKFIQRL